MEWHVHGMEVDFDPACIRDDLLDQDPSALAVMNAAGDILRVYAEIDKPSLLRLLQQGGIDLDCLRVEEIPSLCCGGCT